MPQIRKQAFRLLRRATAPARLLPRALLIGVQKGGSTSLYRYLVRHPRMIGGGRKEPGFYDLHYGRGEGWYRANYPLAARAPADAVALDASTGTICHPLAPERVLRHAPDARLVALLRDPVERAWSHYHHTVRLGFEELPFEEAIEREEERLAPFLERIERDPLHYDPAFHRYAYLSRGLYARQLRPWLRLFGRERLLVLTTEEMRADPGAVVARTLAHLGLEPRDLGPFEAHNVGHNKDRVMAPAMRARLRRRFAPADRELRELLGRDPGWGGEPVAERAGSAPSPRRRSRPAGARGERTEEELRRMR